jgi:hypothetical protein
VEKRGDEIVVGEFSHRTLAELFTTHLTCISVHAKQVTIAIQTNHLVRVHDVPPATEPPVRRYDKVTEASVGRINEDALNRAEVPVILRADTESFGAPDRKLDCLRWQVTEVRRSSVLIHGPP